MTIEKFISKQYITLDNSYKLLYTVSIRIRKIIKRKVRFPLNCGIAETGPEWRKHRCELL